MVKDFAEALMSADADAVCGAGYGERTPERVNRRNGYRERDWDTRVGLIELAVPKLREGSYFPDWLLQPRRRAEQAFVSVIADAYLAGVSTRRVEKLVQQLGVERISKSQVSRLAQSLDGIVEDFRTRPLDGAPYAYVTLDALVIKCREGGRIVNVCVVHAVGVNRDGFRESLGLDVVTAEDGAAWLAFVRGLVARGLTGVKLVSSDAHSGLVDAIAAAQHCSETEPRPDQARPSKKRWIEAKHEDALKLLSWPRGGRMLLRRTESRAQRGSAAARHASALRRHARARAGGSGGRPLSRPSRMRVGARR
jgi:transposase-like protein